MKVEVLGTGCPKCRKLFEVVSRAAEESGLAGSVSKVEDIQEIMRFEVIALPALAVDGKVVLAGRIPSLEEARDLVRASRDGR